MRKGCTLIYNKIWSKYSQWWSFSESKPVLCTNSFRGKTTVHMILASCMANLSKFHVVFSSSTHIRLDKYAFEGHLCQTVNNFAKQNKSSLLSPLRKRRPPQGWSCSFYYLAPIAWNNLPAQDSVVESDTINTFKNRLDNHWKDHPLRYDFLATTPNMCPAWPAL